jgi:hypothetical protein
MIGLAYMAVGNARLVETRPVSPPPPPLGSSGFVWTETVTTFSAGNALLVTTALASGIALIVVSLLFRRSKS